MATLQAGAQGLLVRESGGAAQALAEYVEPFLDAARGGHHAGRQYVDERALDERDASFSDRLRALLGSKGAHGSGEWAQTRTAASPLHVPAGLSRTSSALAAADSVSEAALDERRRKLRRAATYAHLLSVYSVRADAGRSLDEAMMNASAAAGSRSRPACTPSPRQPHLVSPSSSQAICESFKQRESSQRAADLRKSRRKQLLPLVGHPGTHVSARSSHPQYPRRALTPDDRVLWRFPWDRYRPVEFTHDQVKAQPEWADPADPRALGDALLERVTAACEAAYNGGDKVLALRDARINHERPLLDPTTRIPSNPRGRTGTSGRGLLGKVRRWDLNSRGSLLLSHPRDLDSHRQWGPNHAADLVATRFTHEHGIRRLTMLAVQRRDTSEWAIPGGMLLTSESAEQCARRQFTEVCGAIGATDEHQHKIDFELLLDELFTGCEVVYVQRRGSNSRAAARPPRACL